MLLAESSTLERNSKVIYSTLSLAISRDGTHEMIYSTFPLGMLLDGSDEIISFMYSL